MTPSRDEFLDVKIEVAVVKEALTGLIASQKENAEASTKLSNQISDLLVEMRDRDVRDEYQKEELQKIKETQEKFTPCFERMFDVQKRKDAFYEGLFGNWGKIMAAAILLGLLMVLGITPAFSIK